MAKGQSRKPGRDVRGGSGKRGAPSRPKPGRAGGRSVRDLSGSRRQGEAVRPRRDRNATHGSPHAEGVPGTRRTGKSRQNGGGDRRRRGSASYIEGRRACSEALDAGVPVRRALVARAAPVGEGHHDPALARLVDRIAAAGIEVESVARAQLDGLSSRGAHQGIMLEAAPFAYATLPDIIAAAGAADNALIVICDHVTDEGNLGAIVRSAEVVGAAGVVIARARAAGVGVGAYKASAGAVLHVPIAQVANIAAAIDELKAAGFWAVAATEHAADTAWDAPLAGRIALVMGAEATGVSHLVQERCDVSCRLPQRGRIESLNVAQAATVLCYEWLRRSYHGQDVGASSEGGAHGQ